MTLQDYKPMAAAAARIGAAYNNAYHGDIADRVRRFLPMVRRQAWHVHGAGRAGIELEDLMQAGLLALTEAAQRHSGPSEDGFAAYAKMRARGAMVDLVRRTVPLSRGMGEKRRMLREQHSTLRLTLGRDPSEAELALALGLSDGALAQLRIAGEPLRFETLDDAYSDSNMAFADDRPDSFAILAGEETREALTAAIAALPERLAMIVQLYFVEELNLAEIAAVLGVSVPRTHQLKAQALDQLRAALSGVAEIL